LDHRNQVDILIRSEMKCKNATLLRLSVKFYTVSI